MKEQQLIHCIYLLTQNIYSTNQDIKDTQGFMELSMKHTYRPIPLDHSYDRNVPCALCEVTGRTNKIMIPSHYECPNGWRREYYGYLMAGSHDHKAAIQYTCVDKSLEQIPGSAADTNGYLFFTVEAYCDHHIPCSDKEVTCVVCTK